MTYLSFSLRAVNPQQNVDRVYKILLNKGLFNSWLVTTTNGRQVCTQQRTHIFFDQQEAHKFIQQVLNKRFKAHTRIGCNYELLEAKGDEDIMQHLKL